MQQRQLHLRRATDADIPFLAALFRDAHPEFEYLPLEEPQKTAIIQQQFQLQTQDYSGNYPEGLHSIIEMDGQPIGRLWLDFRETAIHVLDVSVASTHRNAGIGSAVLEQVKSHAEKQEKSVTSMVARFNPGSLRWHQKLGFAVVHEDEMSLSLEWRAQAAGAATA